MNDAGCAIQVSPLKAPGWKDKCEEDNSSVLRNSPRLYRTSLEALGSMNFRLTFAPPTIVWAPGTMLPFCTNGTVAPPLDDFQSANLGMEYVLAQPDVDGH